MSKIKLFSIITSTLVIILIVFYFNRPIFSERIYPKLKEYSLMRPIGINDENEALKVYYIDYLYKYDSLDLAILKTILESYPVDYKITTDNEILISMDFINFETVESIDNARRIKKSQILQ